jgi:predicted cupin superfamily sugar epimerase
VDLPGWAANRGLQQHPEGGWFAETWRSQIEIGDRTLASSILFLLMPGEVSAWHVVSSDELWIHQRGGPLTLGLGGNDPAGPGPAEEAQLGTDVGQAPQLLVPAGTWQTARPTEAEPVLVACVVAPGFDYRDWRLAD